MDNMKSTFDFDPCQCRGPRFDPERIGILRLRLAENEATKGVPYDSLNQIIDKSWRDELDWRLAGPAAVQAADKSSLASLVMQAVLVAARRDAIMREWLALGGMQTDIATSIRKLSVSTSGTAT